MCSRNPIQRYEYNGYMAKVTERIEPTIFDEARGKPESTEAFVEEMDTLQQNQVTLDLFPLPSGRQEIGRMWVFKIKHDVDGVVSRHKVRLVVKGYAQTQGHIDYEETFALVAKMEMICSILSLTTS